MSDMIRRAKGATRRERAYDGDEGESEPAHDGSRRSIGGERRGPSRRSAPGGGAAPRGLRGRDAGEYPSIKAGGIVTYGSQIERDLLCLLDYEQRVLGYRRRPFSIELPTSAGLVRYLPDFAVDIEDPETRTQRHYLLDVLPSHLAGRAEARRLYDCIADWCRSCTYDLKSCVITDRDLRAGCYLDNVRLLTRFAGIRVEPEARARVLAALQDAQPDEGITLGILAALLSPAPTCLCVEDAIGRILHLAFVHDVSIPLDEWLISAESPVRLRAHESTPEGHPLAKLLAPRNR